MKKQYITYNLRQTQKIAKSLAKDILKTRQNKNAVVIGLVGDLGTGKTTFVQGFAKGLGIKEKILSPTFVIMKKYRGCTPVFFYHIDCYRVENPKEILDLGFKKIISEPKNIIIIEWADKIKKIISASVNEAGKKRQSLLASKNIIWINFDFIDIKTRKIVIR